MFHRRVEPIESAPGSDAVSVYVHLPFCRVKCTYCAFAISTDSRFEEQYVSALITEMRERLPQATVMATLYFGGGTPSLISERSVERIGAELAGWNRADDSEVTLEANPEDVTEESLARWKSSLGVNRLSIGVQSFHAAELDPLGRGHGRQGVLEAIELASGNISRLSVDLILGLPNQTVESVAESAELALSGPAGHLSLYLLDLEPGSALERRVASGLVDLPAEDETAEMYRRVVELAREAGLEQYEVSNFARPGQMSIHNRRYWQRKPYIGLGLGAHSFDQTTRSSNTRDIRKYVEMIESGELPRTFEETLSEEDVWHERIFLGLRQSEGLPVSEVRSLAGSRTDEWLEEALEQEWITLEDDRVRFTVEGFLVSDELLAELF